MASTERFTTIEINKEDIKFSAAHFTIFSATERERLHGHNYFVGLEFTAPVGDNGLCFSYNEIKSRLRAMCEALDEYMLLPEHSPYLAVTGEGPYYRVGFDRETMYFLRSDTRVLPVRNITLEELSQYLLEQLLGDEDFLRSAQLARLVLRVSSGAGQWGSATWRAEAAPGHGN